MANQPPLQLFSHHKNDIALRLFQSTNQLFVSTRNLQLVLIHLARKTVEYLDIEGCLIWLQEKDNSEELTCQATYHMWLDQFQIGRRIKSSEGIIGQVFAAGASVTISEITPVIRNAPDINTLGSGTVRSLLAVPIVFNSALIGVIEFINKIDGKFDAHDQELAEALTASAAMIIGNALMVESLQQQIDDLQTRNEDLDAFAHSVAHDLQNPLSQIVGFAQLLEFKLDALSDEERQYVLNALTSSANKMSSIIQELLLLASVRKTEITPKQLDMQEIVSHAIQRLDHMITETKAELILPETWPVVYGYAPWVEEIWENYLSNAVKYGGTPPHIILGSSEQPYGMVQFWVRDNGAGFDPGVEEQLFAPFTSWRQKPPHNYGNGGHGLGLSIVRRIVEKLGGTVAAECIQGQGSIFSFTLPQIKIED